MAFLTILLCWAQGPANWAFVTCMLWILGLLAGLRTRFLLRSLQPVLPFALLTLTFQLFLIQGPLIWPQIPWISWSGLERGGLLAARMVAVAVVFQLLASTTSPLRLCDALERWLAPWARLGLPVKELALVASISLRFVPILTQEAEVLCKAQIARGAPLDDGPLHRRIAALFSVLVPLLLRTFRYSDELALAMESRGYNPAAARTRLHPLRYSRLDLYAWIALGALFGICWELQKWA